MILILGPAGAGKSVQGKLLVDRFGYHWLSVGELLRQHLDEDPEMKQKMLEGHLVDDNQVNQLVETNLLALPNVSKVVFDGFPRKMEQALWFQQFLDEHKLTLTALFHIHLPLEVARARLLKRGRLDDTPEAIETRFHEYQVATMPIVQYFDDAGAVVHQIDGSRSVEEVHQSIIEILGLQ